MKKYRKYESTKFSINKKLKFQESQVFVNESEIF